MISVHSRYKKVRCVRVLCIWPCIEYDHAHTLCFYDTQLSGCGAYVLLTMKMSEYKVPWSNLHTQVGSTSASIQRVVCTHTVF